MADRLPALLLCVFATHLPFFAWLYVRTGELRYAATSLTFALLTLTYALRVFAPQAAFGGIELHRLVRVPALAAAAVSIGLLIRHHLRSWRGGAGPRR